MTDHPFDEVVANAASMIEQGAQVFQKFTCENCGNRLTMEEPNRFWTSGLCDKCGHETDIRKNGHNFLLVASVRLSPQRGDGS